MNTLDFSSNYLGLNGMAVLLDVLAECLQLESLSFENNYLKPESIPHLVKIIKGMPSLSALNLANNSTLGFSTAKLLLQVTALCCVNHCLQATLYTHLRTWCRRWYLGRGGAILLPRRCATHCAIGGGGGGGGSPTVIWTLVVWLSQLANCLSALAVAALLA